MKIILIIYICSSVSNICLPPLKHDAVFTDIQSCMLKGYKEGYNWTQKLGKDIINKDRIYVKFRCLEEKDSLESPGIPL